MVPPTAPRKGAEKESETKRETKRQKENKTYNGDGQGWRAPSGVAGPGGGVEKGTITLIINRPLLPGSGYPMGARRPAATAKSAVMAKTTTTTAGNDGNSSYRARAARADTRLRVRLSCGGDRRRVRSRQA